MLIIIKQIIFNLQKIFIILFKFQSEFIRRSCDLVTNDKKFHIYYNCNYYFLHI